VGSTGSAPAASSVDKSFIKPVWHADEDLFTLGPSCGRVYRDSLVEETGTAPVALRVDVAAGPMAEAIRMHWDLST
jgi:hypothetical protein